MRHALYVFGFIGYGGVCGDDPLLGVVNTLCRAGGVCVDLGDE